MTSLRYAATAAALCTLVLAAAPLGAHSTSAGKPAAPRPTPTPTPVALQYDQISRMVMPPATAPPPGSFDESYRRLIALADATPSPQPAHHGFPSLGGMLARGLMKHVAGGPASMQSMLEMMRDGSLERMTYYKNWVRIDQPVQHTATIEKCDRHETIFLDLAKKTYRIVKTSDGCVPAPPASATMPQMPGNMVDMAPGTATMTISSSEQGLGSKMLEGYRTDGTQTHLAMTISGATGSCRNGSSSMSIVRYISGIDKWRAYCPLPRVAGAPPTSPESAIARGGCKPHVATKNLGYAAVLRPSNKLVLYRLMEMQSDAHNGRFGSLLERGNVRWLYRPEAERLFSIPPGFTEISS